ncbi:hypothetical protein JCM30566_13290 [Marinitoga arctica]
MKKILLFILISILMLFLFDIYYIKRSTTKITKNLNIEKKDTQKEEIINIDVYNQDKNVIVKTWFKIITDGKSVILKDILYSKEKIYIIGQNEKINNNLLIITMNLSGNIISKKEISVSSNTKVYKAELIDNNIYIVGTQDFKPVIYIISNTGELLKSKTFEKNGEFFNIKKDMFDNIYIVGYIIENSKKTGYFMEINKKIEKLNEFKINWYNDEIITNLIPDRDFIYLIGYTNSTANNNKNIFLIKLNKLNYNNYTITKYGKEQLNEIGYTILKDDNNFYIVGYSTTLNNFPWKLLVIKIDKNFNELWRKDYLLKKSSRGLDSFIYNDNIYISGYALENNNDFDGFLVFINKNDGVLLKENYYGEIYDERILNSKLINNKAILSVGYQKSEEGISGIILYSNLDGRLNDFMK